MKNRWLNCTPTPVSSRRVSAKERRKSWQTGVMSRKSSRRRKRRIWNRWSEIFRGSIRGMSCKCCSPRAFLLQRQRVRQRGHEPEPRHCCHESSRFEACRWEVRPQDITTLYKPQQRTLALEAARKKPVSERYDGQHCASPTLFAWQCNLAPHTHTHVIKHATNHALNLFRFHPP